MITAAVAKSRTPTHDGSGRRLGMHNETAELSTMNTASAAKSQAVHRAVAPSDPSPPALNRRRTSQAENNSMALSPPKATKAGLLAATPLPTATINSTVIQARVKRWSRATRSRGFACVKVCVDHGFYTTSLLAAGPPMVDTATMGRKG
jgi:hypothetical protein